jgi:MoaA/NifB/PqqE/SkfB family radical SAM enzyme
MILRRREKWGEILYDTKCHTFRYKVSDPATSNPYPTKPLVLNVDLTFKCNMICTHCVANDLADYLGGVDSADLVVTAPLIKKINSSPFLVIVITGGEPMLPEYEGALLKIITGIKNKGLTIDTNGTIYPSERIIKVLKSKDVLVRISWDTPDPLREVRFRRYPRGLFKNELDAMDLKQKIIRRFIADGLMVAVQTVMHDENFDNNNFLNFPYKLKKLGVRDWYIQRFIPSRHEKKHNPRIDDYEKRIAKIQRTAKLVGVNCHYKKDRRHNSVFLLVRDGDLYTQSDDTPGGKELLGKMGRVDYFRRVSAPDHKARYLL